MKTLGIFVGLAVCALVWVLGCVALSCSSPPAPALVSQTVTDAQACTVGILATSSGAPDVADLLRCGLTAADLYALVVSLLKQAQGGDAGASGALLSPNQAAWTSKLQTVKAKLEALDAGK